LKFLHSAAPPHNGAVNTAAGTLAGSFGAGNLYVPGRQIKPSIRTLIRRGIERDASPSRAPPPRVRTFFTGKPKRSIPRINAGERSRREAEKEKCGTRGKGKRIFKETVKEAIRRVFAVQVQGGRGKEVTRNEPVSRYRACRRIRKRK